VPRPPSRFPIGIALAALLCAAGACRRGEPLPEDRGQNRALAAGRTIFERKCASCHGLNGDGRTVTAGRFPYANLIDGKWRGDGSLASIEEQIRRGKDPMPKFQGKLTDEEIRETAQYVLDLAARAEAKKK
jgi:mono/diheme cytochrome c family protein